MSRAGALALGLALATAAPARGEPIVLRMATLAPDGTAWARELRAFGRDVQTATGDEVQVKWYFSGIAGDELRVHERVQRDQLDGVASGGMLCQRLSPSLHASGMVAEFRDRGEATYVMNRLRPTLDDEFARSGYYNLADGGMGFSVIFTSAPVRTMADLRKLRPWLWSLDDTLRTELEAMGLHPVPLTPEDGQRAFDEKRVDSFLSTPSAALAFQWSTQARYVLDLHVGYLAGCVLVSRRAWDALSHEQQQSLRAGAAKLQQRLEDVARQNDELLLKGLLARQGLTPLPVAPSLQSEWSELAQKTHALVAKTMPPGTMERVLGWISDYRKHETAR
jgi:TRAP-type C4-dicarboxylate transport system substrate-binding protein